MTSLYNPRQIAQYVNHVTFIFSCVIPVLFGVSTFAGYF